MDIVIKVSDDVLRRVRHRVSCIHNLRIEMESLRNRSERIATKREYVSGRVEADRRNGMVARLDVTEWLRNVNALRNNVYRILQEGEDILRKKSWLSCYPPKICWSSYKMVKKIATKIEELRQLSTKGDFEVVSVPSRPFPVIAELTELTGSQNSKFSEIWSCLEDDYTGIIGILGVGGSGKTTILRKLHKSLLQSTALDFDVVICARMSQVPNVDKIQDEIRRGLGMLDHLWKSKSPGERTRDIFSVLSEKKFVLLLDDIWEGFDFKQVGVPFPKDHQNKSKVVFTTRSDAICAAMNVDRKFDVKALPEEEGWKLFSKTVGEETLNSHPRILELAKDIARECGILPLAIVTLGGALAKQSNERVWEDSLNQLRRSSPPNFAAMHDLLFYILELSYGFLEDNITKSCFRFCSLLPVADRDQLIDYWVGEGFLGESDDTTRDRGYTIIEGLVKSCLLMAEGSSSLRMHDIVREVALEKAKAEGEKLLVRAGAFLTQAPEAAKWREAHRISLTYNGIENLPAGSALDCPNLSTLILFKSGLKTIPDGFFQSMPSLKVLDLSWCEMGENILLEIANNLLVLQYLSLSHTDITKLPDEFKNLVKLKVLDVSYTAELNAIPQGMIAALESLQVLNTYCSGYEEWIVEEGEMVVGSEEFVGELERVELLNHLGISIKDVQALERLEQDSARKVQSSTHSLLIMRCKGLTHFQLSSIKFMVRLRMLEIRNCADLVEIQINQLVPEANRLRDVPFYSLQHVKIEGCWSLEELTWLSLVPNLETLDIDTCMNLGVLVDKHGDGVTKEGCSTPGMFPRLKRMWLINLPKLSRISNTAMVFRALEEIRVSFCPKLKQLPIDSPSSTTTFKLIEGQRKWWDELEWKDDNIKEALVPRFKQIQY